MKVTVSSRHTEVSDALRAATEEKIGRLARFFEGMDIAEVHFLEERNPRITDKEICEVTLEGRGFQVRCKVSAPDGFVAVDRAVEKLEHQLHKLKTKITRRHHVARRNGTVSGNGSGSGDPETIEFALPDEEGELGPRIVKTKRFAMKPMTPEEAALQMDLLGHDFFFFRNAESERAAVVYRRADGDVGLIEEAR
ncbi:MAG: ribosome hibernation-promoting factor, HPF/YfiA family [Acidimicrobiales bacterium]